MNTARTNSLQETVREVVLGEFLFRLNSEQDWIRRGQSLADCCGATSRNAIWLDAFGRPCLVGKDFQQATADDAYPVTVYRLRQRALGSQVLVFQRTGQSHGGR